METNLSCQKLSTSYRLESLMSNIGCDKVGKKIMLKKSKQIYFHIKGLKNPAANILKQEALSLGGDLAVPKEVILCKNKYAECILMLNFSKLEILIKKLQMQDFGLKDIAEELKKHLIYINFPIQIMGVLNANKDSFFSKSRFDEKNALQRLEKMINDEANIIDIGGVSSRPGSISVSCEEELGRIKPIIDKIYKHKLYEKVEFSLDTYSPLCAKYALDMGFTIINDIQGLQNSELARICGEKKAKVCIMHMQNKPEDMQKKPFYKDIIREIDKFFTKQIQKAKSFGIRDIILDVGIGFGKTLKHNLDLIRSQGHFLHHGYPLLVGASRKSLIDTITPTPIEERLPGSLAVHLEALKNGASIIRCHDVKEHVQALKVYEALQKG